MPAGHGAVGASSPAGAGKVPPVNASRVLKIASVDPERRFSGGETQVLALAEGLKSLGHRVDIFCDPQGELWKHAQERALSLKPLSIRNSVDFIAGVRLARYLARDRYDVVHFHTARAHAMAPFIQARAAARIVTRRMDYVPGRLAAHWLYNRAVDRVIAISRGVERALRDAGVTASKIVLIPSAVDTNRFRPARPEERVRARERLGLQPGELAIGTLGALEARKGHRHLLNAIHKARASRLRFKLFIAGEGSERHALEQQVAQLGIGERVVMPGRVDDPRELLCAMDLFVLPSLKEGLGVAMLEAMASGLPVIASAVGGIPDAVSDGVEGFLVPPGDSSALARALIRMASDPQLRRRLGEAGRERVEADFSVATMTKKTLELYFNCLDGRRCGA